MNNEDSKNFEGKLHSPSHFNKDMRDSSIDAFLNDAVHKLKTRGDKLIGLFKANNNAPMSREMAARTIGLRSGSAITQVVKDLIASGVLQESKERVKCAITGSRVYYLRLKPKEVKQADLFNDDQAA